MSKNDYIIPEKNIVPKGWVSLSDDEIYTMRNANTQFYFGENHTDELKFARAIEQALREKNER